MLINETPVRTCRNFKINSIEIDDYILEKLENDENDKKIGKMLKMKLEDIYNEFIRSYEFQ